MLEFFLFSYKSLQRRGRLLGANSEKSSGTTTSGLMLLVSCLWVSLQGTQGTELAMEICLSEPVCSSAWCLAGSQHCKGLFLIMEELPSACAGNLMRSTSETFIVMNHIAMNSPVVGGGPDLEMAQRPAHLLSNT